MDNQTYEDIGYSKFFKRSLNIPENNQISEYEVDSTIQGISANKVQGGLIVSQNGKLKIDLDQGILTYNDGAIDLFELSDTLTVRDIDGNTIISS